MLMLSSVGRVTHKGIKVPQKFPVLESILGVEKVSEAEEIFEEIIVLS